MNQPLEPVSLADIRAARTRIEGTALRTPLLPLQAEPSPADLYLKLENLQPIGSFKLRGAANALGEMDATRLRRDGVHTASAGNWAQGLAWVARERKIPCRIVVPDHAPRAKTDAIARLGAEAIRVPFDRWWRAIIEHRFDGLEGEFVHPVSDPRVIAGNATAGLEIAEDLPDVDAVVVPFGGGGLSTGIACALRGLGRSTPVYAAEVETAAPLAASLAAGRPQTIERTSSFIDGIGGKSVLEEMWPLAREVLAGSIVVSVPEVARAIRLLATRNRVVAEGAGAAAVAAALTGRAGTGRVVCVVSGGNIDPAVLSAILAGSDSGT